MRRNAGLRHRHCRRQGAAIAEVALILPVFLFLVCGLLELGWMYYLRHSMNLTARESVRSMAVRDYTKEQAESFARERLGSLSKFAYTFHTTKTTDPTVAMEIRLPFRQATLFGSAFFSPDGEMVASAELVRETAY